MRGGEMGRQRLPDSCYTINSVVIIDKVFQPFIINPLLTFRLTEHVPETCKESTMFEIGGSSILAQIERFWRENVQYKDDGSSVAEDRDAKDASDKRDRNWAEEDFLWCWQSRGFW